MPLEKKCKTCDKPYKLDDTDLEFYKKISSEFGGTKYDMPSPNLCPSCRSMRRMVWRNERTLYKNKCSLCDRAVVSIYSPDKKFKALCADCYWSDRRNQLESGGDYIRGKSFFAQFRDLMSDTYLLALFATNCENCEFVNQEMHSSNCYLCTGGNDNLDSYYCNSCVHNIGSVDCYGVGFSEKAYNCVFCTSVFDSRDLFNCHTCHNCYFCNNCVGCESCFGCSNLRYKKYHVFNKPVSKEEFQRVVEENFSSPEAVHKTQERFAKHRLAYPYKYMTVISCTSDCTGDILMNCKSAKDCYYCFKTENTSHSYLLDSVKDSMDILSVGSGELFYESASSTKLYGSAFLTSCDAIRESFYCYNCTNSHHLFGCVSLDKKSYCIFNKQYTKEQYGEKVAEIIGEMQKAKEWGEFFPIAIAPFCYNESNAIEHFSLNESAATKLGACWQNKDYSKKHSGPFYKPKDISDYSTDNNPDAEKEIESCLRGVIKCGVSGRPFRIIPQELAFYIKQKIQIPTEHPDERYKKRISLFNKMQLQRRQCMCEEGGHDHEGRCPNEFETTYTSDRPEKVYCESCYQKSVI